MNKVTIHDTSDWKNQLAAKGLKTVVDPMVFRSGEFFLKGASGVQDPESIWGLLSANIQAIGMFFDCLVLNDKIPVFNYGDTFDSELNFDQRVLTRVNQKAEILYDVDVEYQCYQQVKWAALAELKKAYEGPRKIQPGVAREILSELSAAEYRWKPYLGELESQLTSNDEKQLAGFLLGALIFGGYAQLMESEQILQPKRSRILLALALHAKSSGHKVEEDLFAELRTIAHTAMEDLPWRPSFFPYLLSKADTPSAILQEVVKLRKSQPVAEYRQWLQHVMQDRKDNGKISRETRQDVKKLVQNVERKLGAISSLPRVEIKVTIADAIIGKPPGGVDFTPVLQGLWGWFLDSLPGNRYRKLLTRAVVEDYQYVALENRVKTVWSAG